MAVSKGSGINYSRTLGVLLLAACVALAGCQSRKERDAARMTPQILYKNARKALDNNDFEFAAKQYESLTARFPFSDETRVVTFGLTGTRLRTILEHAVSHQILGTVGFLQVSGISFTFDPARAGFPSSSTV